MSPARLLLAAALALSIPTAAIAAERGGVSMELKLDGRSMTEYRSGSKSYVEARKGRNYSIVLKNNTGARVAVALAVDGLNSIDAKHTAAIDAKKWVLGPYETATIAGWQVDGEYARKFVFTSEDKSYGAWLGQTSNLGVISAVFYAERPGPVCCTPTPYEPYGRYDRGGDDADGVAELEVDERRREGQAESPRSPASTRKAPQAEPIRDTASTADSGERMQSGSVRRGSGSGGSGKVADSRPAKKSEERAATGMGSRTRHHVEWVAFDLDPEPLASFDVRYAYKDELVALGIDPDWPAITPAIERRERAQGFAPDPGHACCR